MRSVFLDHQSSTPVLPEVFEAMRPFFTGFFGNPSSQHHHGLRARDALAQARAQVAQLIHAESPDDIIFTSDGTESANLAIKGAAFANQRKGNHLIVSQTEHPSVLSSVEFLEKHGFTCTRVKVDSTGLVDPEQVRAAITDKTILIAVHHANHDIGTIQPIRAIAEIANEFGITFYADAEASAGWIPVHVRELGVDLLSFSPHRFYGPKGVGVLYRNRNARLTGIIHGGLQENGRRAGIENVPAIVGAGVAAEIATRDLPSRSSHVQQLQQKLWQGLQSKIPHIKLNGPVPTPTPSAIFPQSGEQRLPLPGGTVIDLRELTDEKTNSSPQPSPHLGEAREKSPVCEFLNSMAVLPGGEGEGSGNPSSPAAPRLPTNLNIAFESIEGEGLMLACDMNGIAIASGSGCLSKSLKPSYILDAIGLDPALARGSVILSLGKDNTVEDINYTVETFSKIVEKLRAMSPTWQ